MKFKDLKVGDNNIEIYSLVMDVKLRQTVNQTPYFGLTLSDGDEYNDARIWQVNIVQNLKAQEIIPGNVYKLTIKVNDYAGKNQIIISKIEDVKENEIDVTKFFKTAVLSKAELEDRIYTYIEKINNKVLKDIVKILLNNDKELFFTHPAAITMHHNYVGGLAYHVYSMLQLSDTVIRQYPGINRDLLISGILIHDIGKTIELTSDKAPTYSKEGNLLGHIVIGLNKLTKTIFELGYEKTEEALALQHLMIAHHGELDFGSPKEPTMMEALALHLIDLMDSKLAGVSDTVIKTDKGTYSQGIPTVNKKNYYIPNID